MSAGPLTKQRWRTLLFFKVLHMKLPSLLSFSLPTLTLSPTGRRPVSNPNGGKTYFNRCPVLPVNVCVFRAYSRMHAGVTQPNKGR